MVVNRCNVKKNGDSITKKNYFFNPKDNFQGSILSNLICLSVPIAIFLLFQHLGTSIDFFIIGNPKDTVVNVDAAISYMKQIIKILQSIAIALGSAGVVLVAHEYKKENKEKSKQYATLAFLLAVIISLFFLIIFGLGVWIPGLGGLFFRKEYHDDGGLNYYYLTLITFIFITINSVFISLERVKNKNRLIFILNILLITFRIIISFIYKFSKKEGTVTVIDLALANLLSNLLITFIAFYYMLNPTNPFQIQFKKLIFPKDIVQSMLKLSGTLIIGKATYEIGKKVIHDMITGYSKELKFINGLDLVAISGLVAVVNGIFYSISQSFEDSQTVMVSRSVSREDNSKTFKIFKNVFVISLIIGIIGFLSNYFFGERLLCFLKSSKEFSDSYIKTFKTILFWEGTSLFTSIWASIMMGYILSYNKNANLIFWMNLLRLILRIVILFVLHKYLSIEKTALQFGLSTFGSNMIVLIVITVIFFIFVRKNKFKNLQSQLKTTINKI
ncbi:Na+ driven multidrug efflux pump [Candidatus Phytoplasma luffae]|uniref:Na+ driven multidrug efflux pump n=1 Tax=Loofah witches'-broom phytoplasma TaxID=35773 RepID=A0A975FIV7_LOWBP|nr:MATE family efflux transporter [Candidatus Phytoplasma luffae]QTX02739.1 Na+ driven multidrug efflux pump [Candidatus Phytoplasma luffae]